ncbi:unnamed protein product [Didymodactylos carnosus]|uniref:BTB domain-containing protein n=1 Tax=Didymodactylos carnosus TaxID=1234261 RepID=A0A813U2U7_9BILA|nr:unnamed protein product [Didymodactylos carnosus]CAF3604201.1 unnamed protein product [Didymodactylos carnosus]
MSTENTSTSYNSTPANSVPGAMPAGNITTIDDKNESDLSGKTLCLGDLHCSQLLLRMNKLRKSESLCDITLKVENTYFPAHKIVLAAASDYFAAMFTGEMLERHMPVVEIKGLTASVMEAILNSIYAEQVPLTNENVQDILPAASLLQLNDIQKQCAVFLASHLEPYNCLGIYCFADLNSVNALKQAALVFIYRHFADVVASDEFLTLKANEVEDLIQSDELEVLNEEIVYTAVINWIKHDLTFRSQFLLTLLQHVRMPSLSVRFITDICDSECLIKSSLKCRDLLDEAKRYYLRPDCRRLMTGTRFISRKERVEKWNPRTNEWTQLQSLTKRRRYAAAAAIGKKLFVIGGYDGRTRMNSVECLDLNQENSTWQPVASLSYKRALPGVCTHQNMIYCAGGFDGTNRLASMECYDDTTDSWTVLDGMNIGREGAGLVAVNDHLYCIAVEKYDVILGRWTTMASMLTPRSGAGCATINNFVYACGGFDGTIHLATVERFDIQTNQWTNVTSMSVRRCYCGAAFLRGKIAVIGGYDGQTLLDTVEVYDHESDTWEIESQMPNPRCDSGFAVVSYRQ